MEAKKNDGCYLVEGDVVSFVGEAEIAEWGEESGYFRVEDGRIYCYATTEDVLAKDILDGRFDDAVEGFFVEKKLINQSDEDYEGDRWGLFFVDKEKGEKYAKTADERGMLDYRWPVFMDGGDFDKFSEDEKKGGIEVDGDRLYDSYSEFICVSSEFNLVRVKDGWYMSYEDARAALAEAEE